MAEVAAALGTGVTADLAGGAERLNAELMFVLGAGFDDDSTGDDTLVGGGTGGGAGEGAAKPENSSLVNKSCDGAGTAGFGESYVGDWAKAKSRPFRDALGFGTEGCCCDLGFGGARSKKFPPLKGGGEVTCGTEGVALGENDVALLSFENTDCVGCGGDFGAAAVGKLRPAKASVIPPKGSFEGGGDDMPPSDGCESCVGCAGG